VLVVLVWLRRAERKERHQRDARRRVLHCERDVR
jgi:hypothetical protein